MKKCPKCGVLENYTENEDFVFECCCGFKWRETLDCPVCGGEAARQKEGYYCISNGCGLSHWTPIGEDAEADFKVVFGEVWNKLAYYPDEDLCFLCNAPVLKQEDSSKCQNKLCDFFEQKVPIYRISDARCNPAGDIDGQKDGGKTLLDKVTGLIDISSRRMMYETPHERYRHTINLLSMLDFLKKRPPENLNTSLDGIIQHVKASSPFHPDTFKPPVIPKP